MIKVEYKIPITKSKRVSRYPFANMAIGDSFFVKCGKKTLATKRSSIYGAYCRYYEEDNIIVSIKKVDGGLRCWRVE